MRFHQVYIKIHDAALTDEQVRDYIDTTERLDEARRNRLAGLIAEQVPGFSLIQDEQERLARRSATDRLIGAFIGMARRMDQHQKAAEKAEKWWTHG